MDDIFSNNFSRSDPSVTRARALNWFSGCAVMEILFLKMCAQKGVEREFE